MRASETTAFGGPEVLRTAEHPDPVAGPGEVVVSIAATNINPTDIAARAGIHPLLPPTVQPPFVLGWDLAGTVSSVGEGVEDYEVGDRVVGMVPWIKIETAVGTYAEAAAVKQEWLAPLPDGIDLVEAATLPLNATTARQGLDLLAAGEDVSGKTLLVTGASGAVGGFATQLATADGWHVLAVASDSDEEWVSSLGAAEVLARDTDLSTVGPVDAVFDAVPVGPAAAAAAREGGAILFTRAVEVPERPDLRVERMLAWTDAPILRELAAALAAGRLRTRVARTFDLDEAAAAHRLAETSGLRGKVVITT